MSDRAHNQSWYDAAYKGWPYLLLGIFLVVIVYKFHTSDRTISGSPFAIDAGELQSVPLEIIDLKKLAITYRIQSFAMSNGLLGDHWLYATAREYAYPIKYLKQSNFYFSLEGEGAPAYCQKIGIGKKVILYEC
jgi:hypothetical protein